MIKKSLYEILNVQPDASTDEIKAGFRRLALIHHPDKNGNSPESQVNFQIINNAYSTLSSPEKREAYDTYLNTSSVYRDKSGDTSTGPSLKNKASGRELSLQNLCCQFNFILWEIEDILNSAKQVIDNTLYSGCTIHQWLLKILVFTDRWVLQPAGFIDYFYEARKLEKSSISDLLKNGFNNNTHQPYTDIYDYFYDIRKRMDKFIKGIKVQNVLRTIEGCDIKLIDSIFEAQKLAYHYLGSINLILKNNLSEIKRFNHSNKCFDEDYKMMIEFRNR